MEKYMSNSDPNEEESVFKSKLYYDLSDAVDEVSLASGVKETAAQSAKLIGKGLFNTVIFSGKLGFKILEELPEAIAKTAERQSRKK